MKKLFALALVVLGLAACQTEPEFDVNMGDGTTTISVVLPEDAVTRAGENDSALGGLDNTTGETVRVIFEVYYEGETNADLRQVKYLADGELQTNFDVRLVPGRNYTFVAWADMVDGVDAGDKYYNTENLKNVTLKTNWTAMNESRDAFTATKLVEDFQSTSTIELKLVRPFAKLRIVTTDMEQLNDLGIVPTNATITYVSKHYNAFNAFAGQVIGDSKNRDITHANFAIISYGEDALNKDANKTLFTDYFFAAEDDVVKFTLNVYDQYGEEIGATKDFTTDIPVKRNNLTTIKGNVLTEANNIKVEVTPAFEDESVLPYELLQVLENGGEYKFENDMTIFKTLFINDDTNVVLDLNGKNITLATENEGLEYGDGIIVYGNLTIKGEGTITSKTRTIWARGNYGAEVNILGGHFIGANDTTCEVIYASGDGKINIYGGKFEAVTMDDKSFAAPQYAILNLQGNGKTGCDIKVYGGSFKNFNPSDNISENPKHDFCAEGYTAVANGEWFNVVYDPSYTQVATAAELAAAINNATGDIKIIFLNDIVGDVTTNEKKTINVTIYGDGKTYTGGMTLKPNNVTIKNVNFDGKGYNGYAITTRGTNYLTIEDCTAKSYSYGFVQLASGTVLTTVKNVTVSNMNYGVKVDYSNAVVIENADITAGVAAVLNSNYGEKPITIKNSKFNILGTWKRNNTTKTNYVFEGNNTIDTFKIEAALDNFKLAAGATLTAPNEINVTTVDGYTVEYAGGKYISK